MNANVTFYFNKRMNKLIKTKVYNQNSVLAQLAVNCDVDISVHKFVKAL